MPAQLFDNVCHKFEAFSIDDDLLLFCFVKVYSAMFLSNFL